MKTDNKVLVNIDLLRFLRDRLGKKDGVFTVVHGNIEFLGEGSGAFTNGGDTNPVRRAYLEEIAIHVFTDAGQAEEYGGYMLTKGSNAYVVVERWDGGFLMK